MKKILFPTDFSTTAANAFAYALRLASMLEARIDLLSVYHLPLNDAGQVPTAYIEQMLGEKRQQVLKHLRNFVALADGDPSVGTLHAEYGLFVAQEIIDMADKGGYGLIIMGTKGEHNPLEKSLGSVTTQTMMHATCPVLAIPEGATFEQIENIAYATDFKPTDEHAVLELMELTRLLGAAVHFVHVETKAEIGTAHEEIELEDYPFEFTDFTLINNSSVQEGIDCYIKKKHIDMLALFVPRRRLWERLFHSSFTRRMTFHSRIPLLVFHQ